MTHYQLQMTLLRDTTFGRGDGLAGLIDQEVEYDAAGFPYLRGRTLKGLLSEECDGIVAMLPNPGGWLTALDRLFGRAGSDDTVSARWQIGDARLPADLRQRVAAEQAPDPSAAPGGMPLTPRDVLESLTTLRRQTAIDPVLGTPDDRSLRASRVIVRGLLLTADLYPQEAAPAASDLALLAAGCLALRHAGLGRNRGRGALRCTLHTADGTDVTEIQFQRFVELSQ